jgi:beta-lactamase superfamily II metal-dependent hydrolase
LLQLFIFNVDLGQCIFVLPSSDRNYAALIDCGCDEKIVNFIQKSLPNNVLGSFTLTNYDEDHFSGICDLSSRVKIKTVCFSKNLTSDEIKKQKEKETEALRCLLNIKDKYTKPCPDWNPPYKKCCYSLEIEELNDPSINNLSQMVFLEYKDFTVCIPGDLETEGWEKIIKKPDVQNWLKKTRLFIASHHGRENGYYPGVFDYCKPERIIISDGSIKHGTQEDMSSIYAKHINGNGILFYDEHRKVLTTRNDGHITINIDNNSIEYSKLNINP